MVWYSLHEWNVLAGTFNFVGADNYRKLLDDANLPEVLEATALFSVGLVVLNLSLALLLAVLLNQKLRGHRRCSARCSSRPVVVSLVAWTIVWGFLLQDNGGINGLLRRGRHRRAQLAARRAAPPCSRSIVVQVFKNVGLNMVLFLAALQGVPQRAVRGGRRSTARGRSTQFRRITVPLISPTILLTSIITIVGSLQVFAQIAVLTQGGPGMSTTVLVYYLYQQAFQFHHFGYGSTLSILLFADRAGAHRRASGRCARGGSSMKPKVPLRARVALYGLLCVLAIPFVFPTWWMVTSSFKPVSDIFAFPPTLSCRPTRLSSAYRRGLRAAAVRAAVL